MYSGSDSTESQNYPQWALNPSTYKNMSNDQVDWAALAQQWIIMKEAGPPPMLSAERAAPKPKPRKELSEGGEAPMDVENDKEDGSGGNWGAAQPPNNDWSWNAQSQSWGWNNAWPPTGVPPPAPMKPPLLPTPANFNQYNASPESNSDNATFGGYSTGPNNDYNSGYWTSAGSSKQIKPHNRRFSKVNVPRPIQPTITESQPALDAAKRKQLPAWIREGLEKMERDKVKQIEREKEKIEREEYNEKLKQNEKETMEILKTTIKEQQKSKFESDGESEEEDLEKKKVVRPERVPLTAAEQMMNVRRAMTEILLKVTNREIETICREELQRYHKKYKASDHRVSAPSGANVTAKLGLGMYGSGSGSSSSEDSEDDTSQGRRDSDSELRDIIKRKKAEFSKTEREIEDKLAVTGNRKQELVSRSPSPITNDNDTQVDAKAQGGRPKQHSTTPRAGAPKSQKRSSSSSSSEDAVKAEVRKRATTRRSSTSSSGGNSRKPAQRSRSTSRSRTPEKSARRKSAKSKRRSRSRSESRRESSNRKGRYSRRSRSRSRSASYRRRSRSKNRGSRSKRRSPSPYSRRRSRSRSVRRRRSRSSSSGRGKRSRRR